MSNRLRELSEEVRALEKKLRDAGGAKKLEKLHQQGKLSARERVELLRDTGFELQALHELYAPDGDPDELRHYMRRGWAQQWPGEEVWVARRTSAE